MNPLNRGILLLLLSTIYFQAQSQFISGFSKVEVATGMANPTAMTVAPDGRIFICQQNGAVIVFKNGAKLPTPALQLSVNTSGERGLVGITLHPSFATNGAVYLYYTLPNGSRNRVSRFYMKGDIIDPATEQIIWDLDALSSSPYHNGGAMHFLGDKLFIAVGDNSSGSNSQNLENVKGKILRINANGSAPGDNPFYSSTGSRARNSIWAYGLRNPFTFDIQPGTNRIFVNDVGQEGWEEINEATVKGKNFGWPSTEGKTTNPAYTSPFYAYPHGSGEGIGCAITGGVFFNPTTTNYPSHLIGTYFFLDYCNSWINYIDFSSGTPVRNPFATNQPGQMLAIDVGTDGNLYFLSRAGRLYKVVYTTTLAPVITLQPVSQSKSTGQSVTFSVSATGSNPLTYQWRKNGTNISGATGNSYTIASVQASDAANYSVTVSNSRGTATSNNATLTVTGSTNTAPVATIIAPLNGTMYRAGDVISFSGNATDAEEGTLPASAFSWFVELHHDAHFHDSPPIATGAKTGTYTIPVIGETSINVFYRLILTVTDSQGLTHSTYVDLKPQISIMALQSNPTGLTMTMDGQPYTALAPIRSVEGVQRTIGVVNNQSLGGIDYTFTGWAHGGTASQTLSTPIDNTTYTANFSKPIGGAWHTTDIGKKNIFGDASVSGDTFTVTASGRDIYNNDDQFRFVYQQITGDCDIRARVTSITNTHAWAKAGVMVRETLQPGSINTMTLVSATSGTSFQRRVATDGVTTAANSAGSAPYWVRLVRSGNTFTSYVSSNGTSWTVVGTPVAVPMSSSVYVGLAFTSHASNALGTATFASVQVIGGGTSGASLMSETLVSHDDEDVTVFPNPNDGDILYVRTNRRSGNIRTIQITNGLGQVVTEKLVDETSQPQDTQEVGIGGVAQGFYFVRVVGERGTWVKAFIRR